MHYLLPVPDFAQNPDGEAELQSYVNRVNRIEPQASYDGVITVPHGFDFINTKLEAAGTLLNQPVQVVLNATVRRSSGTEDSDFLIVIGNKRIIASNSFDPTNSIISCPIAWADVYGTGTYVGTCSCTRHAMVDFLEDDYLWLSIIRCGNSTDGQYNFNIGLMIYDVVPTYSTLDGAYQGCLSFNTVDNTFNVPDFGAVSTAIAGTNDPVLVAFDTTPSVFVANDLTIANDPLIVSFNETPLPVSVIGEVDVDFPTSQNVVVTSVLGTVNVNEVNSPLPVYVDGIVPVSITGDVPVTIAGTVLVDGVSDPANPVWITGYH